MTDEVDGESAAGEESVCFCCGGGGGWVVVCGFGEEVESTFAVVGEGVVLGGHGEDLSRYGC